MSQLKGENRTHTHHTHSVHTVSLRNHRKKYSSYLQIIIIRLNCIILYHFILYQQNWLLATLYFLHPPKHDGKCSTKPQNSLLKENFFLLMTIELYFYYFNVVFKAMFWNVKIFTNCGECKKWTLGPRSFGLLFSSVSSTSVKRCITQPVFTHTEPLFVLLKMYLFCFLFVLLHFCPQSWDSP